MFKFDQRIKKLETDTRNLERKLRKGNFVIGETMGTSFPVGASDAGESVSLFFVLVFRSGY